MLRADPHLRATTLLEDLQRRYPERYPDRLLRTLQRRVATWRATEGPEREIIFRQASPGEQALSDFTDGSSLQVTIAGAPFTTCCITSGWRSRVGSTSRRSRAGKLHRADRRPAGGAMAARRRAASHRTDRLSAAYRNLQRTDDEAAAYAAFCQHYGLEPTRNNAGVSHENGSVEAAHGHLKIGLKEALALRGCRDFPDLASYQAFLAEFVMRKNARRRTAVETELKVMRRLPRFRTTDFSVATVTVTLGDDLGPRGAVHRALSADRLEAQRFTSTMTGWSAGWGRPRCWRCRADYKRGAPRQRVVDYRHLIGALVRKPQAFRRSIFRDELFRGRSSGAPGSDRRSSGATQGVPGLCRSCTWPRCMLRGGAR